MIISIIYLIISFLFDGIMSNYFPSTFSSISYFTTIYIVIAFVVIYPHFNNDKKYFILLLIFGILFDMIYTSTILINVIIFIVVGIVAKILYNIFNDNLLMTNIISFISIVVYHLLSYIILLIINYNNYSIILLLRIIGHSVITTIIYTSISYLLIKYIFNKFNIKYIK